MSRKLIAGLLSLILIVSSAGADVLAAEMIGTEDTGITTVSEEDGYADPAQDDLSEELQDAEEVKEDAADDAEEEPVAEEVKEQEDAADDAEEEPAAEEVKEQEDKVQEEAEEEEPAAEEEKEQEAVEEDLAEDPVTEDEAEADDEVPEEESIADDVDNTNTGGELVSTIDGGTVSIAPEGKPMVVLFFSTTCYNCQTVLGQMAKAALSPDIKFVAAEMNNATKDQVTSFVNGGYASDSITYGYGAHDIAVNYYNALGKSGSIEWPFVLYVSSDGVIAGSTNGLIDIFSEIKTKLGVEPTVKTYSVKYDPNGGTGNSMPDTVCRVGEHKIVAANTYSRAGCTFEEWNTKPDGSGTAYQAGDDIFNLSDKDKDVVYFYAIWNREKYTITYNLDGGTNNDANPDSYDVDTDTITLKDPVKQGYKFGGWFLEASFSNRIQQIAKGTTGNKVLYAKWTPVKYSVKFEGNGATSGKMSDMTGCSYDKSFNLKACSFKRKGYEFKGWNTKANGKGTSYANKASVKNLTDQDGKAVTFYAQWKVVEYKVTYKLNGGKNDSGNPKKYKVTTKTITLKKPTRKGYTFAGWFSDKSFKKKVTKISKGSTGNKVFYAKWTANKYNIKFKGNGATSGSMSNQTNLKYGKSYKLKANTFKRTGYTFKGWNTKANGKGKSYANKASVKNLSAKNKATVTFYAQWKLKEYNITYVLNKGKNNKANPATYTVKSGRIVFADPTRKGYTFDGWYADSSFTRRVSKLPAGATGDLTLYAQWTANRYNVRFDGNGSTYGTMYDMTDLKYGKSYSLSANMFSRDGYAFKEWNTRSDGSGESYDDRESIKNLSSKNGAVVTLYAMWRPIKYYVTFDGNGATSGDMTDMTCNYGTKYWLTPNKFKKTKFKFDCWNTKKDGTGYSVLDGSEVFNLTTRDGEYLVLYAQWEEDFDPFELGVSYPSRGDISSFIYNHPYNTSDTFEVKPSIEAPYSAGRLSQQTMNSSVNLLNTYRYIAGLSSNLWVNYTLSDKASKGTLLNALNGREDHAPARPSVLSDSSYNQLYEDGYQGCRNSNLAHGSPSLSMKSAIETWMSDSSSENITKLGHRRWLLYPSLSQVGFGKTDGNKNGTKTSYCAAYVITDEYSAKRNCHVAWPAKNTPTGYFKDGTAWSLSMDRTLYKDQVKVKITRESDHKIWTLKSGSSDGELYVDNGSYGTVSCVIFRPKDLTVKAGDSYTVKVFFYDREEMVTYTVDFFNI